MQPDDAIQDRYRLERRLGTGGMAEVWQAQDERLERPVAVKFLSERFAEDAEFLVRFFAEAQAVARLTHPNVVEILDFGEVEGRPFLVMEFVSGGSLADLGGEPMEPRRAAELVAAAARGAGAAHKIDVVHRDIKPGNILLTDEGTAKLADFGIASTSGSEHLTATGRVLGSPHYVSPEYASGRGIGPPSDVYSLGVVLYELVTGRVPLTGDHPTAIAIAHVEDTPVPPSELVAEVDPELDALVMRCLAKDAGDRFPDGTELATALEEMFPVAAGAVPAVGTATAAEDDPGSTPGFAARSIVLGMGAVLASVGLAWGALYIAGSYDPPRDDRAVAATEPDAIPADSPTPSPSPTQAQAAEPEGNKPKAERSPTPSEEPSPSKEPSPSPTPSDKASKSPSPTPTPTQDDPTPEPTASPTSEQESSTSSDPSPSP